MSDSPKKQMRRKFGLAGGPIPATRVLQMEMEHNFGCRASALITINDQEGTFTAANVYDGNLGRNYDPSAYRHPLPAEGSDSFKKWRKRGYENWDARIPDLDVLNDVRPTTSEPVTSTEEAATEATPSPEVEVPTTRKARKAAAAAAATQA